jgi:hypothetical protein
MAIQTIGYEQVTDHFVNFNRPRVKTREEVDTPKKASDVIIGKLERLNHVQDQLSTLNREEEALKEDIKAYMGSCSVLIGSDERPLVSYKIQTKTVLDKAKFKAAYPELFGMYSKQTRVRSFRII